MFGIRRVLKPTKHRTTHSRKSKSPQKKKIISPNRSQAQWSCILGAHTRFKSKLGNAQVKSDPNAKPVKQPPRKYRLDVEEKIKLEVQKLLKGRIHCRD